MPKSIALFRDKAKAAKYRREQKRKNYIRGGFVGTPRHWTEQEERQLLLYIEQGLTRREIAKLMERSVLSLQKRVSTLRKQNAIGLHKSIDNGI